MSKKESRLGDVPSRCQLRERMFARVKKVRHPLKTNGTTEEEDWIVNYIDLLHNWLDAKEQQQATDDSRVKR